MPALPQTSAAADAADVQDCSLADLAPGARAEVSHLGGSGQDAALTRLGELGFTPGTVVEVVRRAPLRDPVVYRVKDYEICLRRTEARRIGVRVLPGRAVR